MRGAGHRLDVLREVVLTAHHQDVFEAAGDEQFAVVQAAQIPGAYVRPAFQTRPEHLRRLRVPAPVPLAVPRTRHPDLAHRTRGQHAVRRRVDDADPHPGQRRAAADQLDRAVRRRGRYGRAPGQRVPVVAADGESYNGRPSVTLRVHSARPYPGENTSGRKREGRNASANLRRVSARTGSAPFAATRHVDRSTRRRS